MTENFNLVPRALFPGFGGGAVSQRFGHPLLILLQRFGHPPVPSRDAQIPSVLVIPSKKCWISRENRKRFRDGFR